MRNDSCPLCLPPDPALTIWSNTRLHVTQARDTRWPGYTQVIWNDHIAEMTDLSPSERGHFMDAVWMVESAVRHQLSPVKVNLAQLGNQVPHLHWHIIPRWPTDSHFPEAIWAHPQPRNTEQQLAWEVLNTQKKKQLGAYWSTLKAALDSL